MRVRRAVTAILFWVFALQPAAAQQTVGLFTNDAPEEGLILFSPMPSTTTYLINNDGLVVNTWTSAHTPGTMSYLLDTGHLLRSAVIPAHPHFNGNAGGGGRVELFDWDGTLVWEYELSDADHLLHHDIEVLPNGHVLIIVWEYMTEAEAIAAGKNPALVNTAIWMDAVIEVEPTPPVGGNIVWEWHAKDHLIQDFDATKPNFGVVQDHPELVDFNYTDDRDWAHLNGIDYNAALDQIVISNRTLHELWVIDHSTTTAEAAGHTGGNSGKGGDLLYRWGNPQVYRRGTASDQQLFGQHDTQWIEPGLAGAGNMLVYNNGVGRPAGVFSTVDEIVTPVDVNGNYTIAAGAAYGPAAPIWSFSANPATDFYSVFMSGAQRQPNGNMLICEAAKGRLFEIEPDNDVTWDYVSPVLGTGPVAQGDTTSFNAVFKTRRYPLSFPGFAGRDLTPGDPIETFMAPLPVPDGTLRVDDASPGATMLDVTWDAFTCPSFNYNLLYGNLQDVATQAISGAECGIGITGGYLWNGVPAGDLFFLIVGTDVTNVYESSWGTGSAGGERSGTKSSFLCRATTKVISSTCP